MNQQELARQLQRDREIVAELASLGVTRAEASLFHVINYGYSLLPHLLCYHASFPSYYSLGGDVSEEENQAALTGCLAKGWLQFVDEAVLGRIQSEIREAGILGPIYGYPALGGINFTHEGAEQWLNIRNKLWNDQASKPFVYCDTVCEKHAFYFSSEAKAVAELDRWKRSESVVAAVGPFPIGPWRANWWRRFSKGYRIEVEQRTPWRGRVPRGGAFIDFNWSELRLDLLHARAVLDRQQVRWVEWVLLGCMESGNNHQRLDHEAARIVEKAIRHSKQFGIDLSEEECMSGLETCVRLGYLCEIDDQRTTDILGLLRADSAIMPVPFKEGWREVEFTMAGADLYRRLSTEILGIGWENRLEVKETYYWEVHHYCTHEAGLKHALRDYARLGETPKTIRTIATGPWCVLWWNRYQSGFRLELTFGHP